MKERTRIQVAETADVMLGAGCLKPRGARSAAASQACCHRMTPRHPSREPELNSVRPAHLMNLRNQALRGAVEKRPFCYGKHASRPVPGTSGVAWNRWPQGIRPQSADSA